MAGEAELAEFVMNHLGHGTPMDPFIGAVVNGLAEIGRAFGDAQAGRGNWGAILSNLRSGTQQVTIGMNRLRDQAPFAGLLAFAERQHRFALLLIDEIVRLQAGESTPV
jgi:hypothetical protein